MTSVSRVVCIRGSDAAGTADANAGTADGMAAGTVVDVRPLTIHCGHLGHRSWSTTVRSTFAPYAVHRYFSRRSCLGHRRLLGRPLPLRLLVQRVTRLVPHRGALAFGQRQFRRHRRMRGECAVNGRLLKPNGRLLKPNGRLPKRAFKAL